MFYKEPQSGFPVPSHPSKAVSMMTFTGMIRTRSSRVLFFLLALLVMAAFSTLPAASGAKEPDGSIRLLKDGEFYPALVDALDRAQKEILIAVFLFKTNGFKGNLPDGILSRLEAAVRRGVRVTVLLERDRDPQSQLNRSNEETAKRLRKAGITPCFDSPGRTTHTKIAVIDGRYVFVGSHNFTQSALKYNHEMSIAVDSPSLADEMTRYIRSIER